jgi:aspartate/methionine/tyrosine aminotransferase
MLFQQSAAIARVGYAVAEEPITSAIRHVHRTMNSAVNSAEVTARLLAGGVAVRSGPEFGPSGEGHIRLSFATSLQNLEEGLDGVETVLNRL